MSSHLEDSKTMGRSPQIHILIEKIINMPKTGFPQEAGPIRLQSGKEFIVFFHPDFFIPLFHPFQKSIVSFLLFF